MVSDPGSYVVDWLRSFDVDPVQRCSSIEGLLDGRLLLAVASDMYVRMNSSVTAFPSFQIPVPVTSGDQTECVMTLIRLIQHQFLLTLKRDISQYPIRLGSIVKGDTEALLELIKLLFLAQVECERSEEFLPRILELEEETKSYLAEVVESLRDDPRVQYVEALVGNESEIIERDRREEVEAELDKLRLESSTSLSTKDRIIEELQEQKRALEDTLRKVREDTSEAHLQSQLAELTSSLTDAKNANEEVLRGANREMAQILGDLDSLRAENQTLEARIDDQQTENRRLRDAEEATRRKHVDETNALSRVIEDYRETVQKLTKELDSLQAHASTTEIDAGREALEQLQRKLLVTEEEKESLRAAATAAAREADRIRQDAEVKEKEVSQFIMTGGSLGGDVRDRIIKTMQEQLVVREEELEFYRAQHLEAIEEQRKVERLLVTAVHSLALRYHEEMVARLHDLPNVQEPSSAPRPTSPEDFYSQEYNNS